MCRTKKKKQRPVDIDTFEPMGWIPRSIRRTCERFISQLGKTSPVFALKEFRLSRYQALASLKCLISFVVAPIIFRNVITQVIFTPIIKTHWDKIMPKFLLTNFQQFQLIQTAQNFEEICFFDSLIQLNNIENTDFQPFLATRCYKTFNQIFISAEHQSLWSIINIFANTATILFLILLWFRGLPQRIILRSFLVESLYSLRDEWRAFLLILITDLLVGFHSSRGWELLLTASLISLGQNPNKDVVGLFVSTFPVLLDTVFKYWIFRYLNKISPSTVATYQSMLE